MFVDYWMVGNIYTPVVHTNPELENKLSKFKEYTKRHPENFQSHVFDELILSTSKKEMNQQIGIITPSSSVCFSWVCFIIPSFPVSTILPTYLTLQEKVPVTAHNRRQSYPSAPNKFQSHLNIANTNPKQSKLIKLFQKQTLNVYEVWKNRIKTHV